jgi:hypothetical protein
VRGWVKLIPALVLLAALQAEPQGIVREGNQFRRDL